VIIVETNPLGYTKIFSFLAYQTLAIPNIKADTSKIIKLVGVF